MVMRRLPKIGPALVMVVATGAVVVFASACWMFLVLVIHPRRRQSTCILDRASRLSVLRTAPGISWRYGDVVFTPGVHLYTL